MGTLQQPDHAPRWMSHSDHLCAQGQAGGEGPLEGSLVRPPRRSVLADGFKQLRAGFGFKRQAKHLDGGTVRCSYLALRVRDENSGIQGLEQKPQLLLALAKSLFRLPTFASASSTKEKSRKTMTIPKITPSESRIGARVFSMGTL